MSELGNIEASLRATTAAEATETEKERFSRRMDRRYGRILQWASTKEKDEIADHFAYFMLVVLAQRKDARILDNVKSEVLKEFAEKLKHLWSNSKQAAEIRHNKPGGSRDKQRAMRDAWAKGKFTSRDRCAEEECAALDMSLSAARKALRNTPDPA